MVFRVDDAGLPGARQADYLLPVGKMPRVDTLLKMGCRLQATLHLWPTTDGTDRQPYFERHVISHPVRRSVWEAKEYGKVCWVVLVL